jgi:hypothetical protein
MWEAVVPGLVGGVVVAAVAGWLAKRQKGAEIETVRLLEAYEALQESIVVISDDNDADDVFSGLSESEKLDLAARTGQVVSILDLLGSRRVLEAIRAKSDDSGTIQELDIGAVKTELRIHIRKRLGLPTWRIPSALTIHTRRSLERLRGHNGQPPE